MAEEIGAAERMELERDIAAVAPENMKITPEMAAAGASAYSDWREDRSVLGACAVYSAMEQVRREATAKKDVSPDGSYDRRRP